MANALKLNTYNADSQLSPALVSGKKLLENEANALLSLAQTLDQTFEEAVTLCYQTKGRIIVTGIGKSGHIARKIAATLSSTGSPAFFIHPSEASHGDLGMIGKDDTVIALSNSGNTKELSDIVYYSKRFSIPLIAITAKGDSFLAKQSDCALILPAFTEACPMGLAPTTSTTMMLALGDALAVTLLEKKGFSSLDFKSFHPGGQLGHQLLKVEDLMHGKDQVPLIEDSKPTSEVLLAITSKNFGCVGVTKDKKLIGIITDGDLRRHMDADILTKTAQQIMTANPKTIDRSELIATATAVMNAKKITSLFICEKGEPIGLLHLHDCLHMQKS